jgi:hypothetical protein
MQVRQDVNVFRAAMEDLFDPIHAHKGFIALSIHSVPDTFPILRGGRQ